MTTTVKFGKTGLRGLKKCPQCSYYNGTRAYSCKNSGCSVVFKIRVPAIEVCRIVAPNDSCLYSVRLKDTGVDCWGFVAIMENLGDKDFGMGEDVRIAHCCVEACVKSFTLSDGPNCQHIQAALTCSTEAENLTLQRSAVDSLNLDKKVKEAVWELANRSEEPLVQRVSKTTMIVRMAKCNKYNIQYTHSIFYTTKLRGRLKYMFKCHCYNNSYDVKKNSKENAHKPDPPPPTHIENSSVVIKKKCVHYYACICVFASNPKLRDEFKEYLDIYFSVNADLVIPTINNGDINYLSELPSPFIEFSDEMLPPQVLNENMLNPLNGQMIELTNESAPVIEIHPTYSNPAGRELVSTDVCLNVTGQYTNYTLLSYDHSSTISNVCGISPLDMQVTFADGDNLIDLPPTIHSSCRNNNEMFSSSGLNITEDTICDRVSPAMIEVSTNTSFLEIIKIEKSSNEKVCDTNNGIKTGKDFNWFMKEPGQESPDDEEEVLLRDPIAVKVELQSENAGNSYGTQKVTQYARICSDKSKRKRMKRTFISKKTSSVKTTKLANARQKKTVVPQSSRFKKKKLKSVNNGSVTVHRRNLSSKKVNINSRTSTQDPPVLLFTEWLSSVTEFINETMHYQGSENPNPLSFYISQNFFDSFTERMSHEKTKKRLPNEIVTFMRSDSPPFGIFTKFIWYLTNIVQVKKLFDTSEVSLELVQYFSRNDNGLYKKINIKNEDTKSVDKKVQEYDAITYLKVGRMELDQATSTPFSIEWIPDLFLKSKTGQLTLQFCVCRKTKQTI